MLDFSQLTDDQLIGLIRAAVAAAVERSPAVRAAAQGAVVEEAELARIAIEAAEKELDRLQLEKEALAEAEAKQWVRQKFEAEEARLRAEQAQGFRSELGQRIARLLRGDVPWNVTVWNRHTASDQRVYIRQPHMPFNSAATIEYYHMGNRVNPAGTLKLRPCGAADLAVACGQTTLDAIRELCVDLCVRFSEFKCVTTPVDDFPPQGFPRVFVLENQWKEFFREGGGVHADIDLASVFDSVETAQAYANNFGSEFEVKELIS